MKKTKLKKILSIFLALLVALAIIIKFGTPSILSLYIQAGLGTCHDMPIFCISPKEEIINPEIDESLVKELATYKLPEIEISVPKNFEVKKQELSKTYYKKKKKIQKGHYIYLLYEKPNFFVNLYPHLDKEGVNDDYDFIKRTMTVKVTDIKNMSDGFFSIMKAIFTPDMGKQENLKIAKFFSNDKKGFITYNITDSEAYFDCNIIDAQGNYFKVYIKDVPKTLKLEQVIAIISTVKKGSIPASLPPQSLKNDNS